MSESPHTTHATHVPAEPPGEGPVVPVMIRAGDEAPGWEVAGLPLLLRLGRQLARAGAGGIRLVGPGAGDGARWRALLARGGCTLDVTAGAAAAAEAASALEAAAIYDSAALAAWVGAGATGAAPTSLLPVRDAAERAFAEQTLWRSIRKSLEHDGPVAYYVARPLAMPATRVLARLGVRPNAVTLVGLLVGLAGGVVAALGGYGAGLGAALCFFAGLLLDCVDGDLARITLATSRLGQWLDTITDDLAYAALAAGLGVGLFREGAGVGWLWTGAATFGLVVVGQGIIYHWLWRSGGPIDTAKYPWFFMGGQGLAQEGERSLVGWLSFAVRRDSLTMVFLVLAAVGWRPGILICLAGGSAIYAVLLAIDLAHKARRREGVA